MTLVNIVSALGNNNSVYPLLVRDCGIENVAKVALTYKQNAKESKFVAKQATRERAIDEYGTSAVWLGGIPILNALCDKTIQKIGLSPKVNLKLFKETQAQGIEYNIKKFKALAPKEVQDLIKIKNNKKLYQNSQIAKFFATTAIPIAIMGFVLPKLNYLYTKKKIDERKNVQTLRPQTLIEFKKNANKINFTGIEKLANMSNLEKMMILDGGLTVGRVKTARNKAEKAEMAFKMAGMCYLNYLAPKSIEKGLNAITKKLFGLNTDLDIKTIADKNFATQIKENKLILPKNVDEKTLLNFIDENSNSFFTTQAKNTGIISTLKNGIRDPRKFVECEELAKLKGSIEEFSAQAKKSGNVDLFIKKAISAKCFNTLANVGISSVLLAIVLPKLQFLFRKVTQGTNLDPGVREYK